jgi:hypothetical protein
MHMLTEIVRGNARPTRSKAASVHVSGITGVLYTSVAFGTLIGPSAAGFAFDRTHTYAAAIVVGAAANALAAAIVAVTSRASGR